MSTDGIFGYRDALLTPTSAHLPCYLAIFPSHDIESIYKRQTVTFHSVVSLRSIYHLTPPGIVSSTFPVACEDGNELPSIPYWRTHLRLFYVQNAFGHHSFNDFSREFCVTFDRNTSPNSIPYSGFQRPTRQSVSFRHRVKLIACHHSLSPNSHSLA